MCNEIDLDQIPSLGPNEVPVQFECSGPGQFVKIHLIANFVNVMNVHVHLA